MLCDFTDKQQERDEEKKTGQQSGKMLWLRQKSVFYEQPVHWYGDGSQRQGRSKFREYLNQKTFNEQVKRDMFHMKRKNVNQGTDMAQPG